MIVRNDRKVGAARPFSWSVAADRHLDARGRTVLVVEDDPSIREVVRLLLERSGWRVLEAFDGLDALDQLNKRTPDVVLLDLLMPRLGGLGVLAHIRETDRLHDLPVVILSANRREVDGLAAERLGVADFIPKPFDPAALSDRIVAAIA